MSHHKRVSRPWPSRPCHARAGIGNPLDALVSTRGSLSNLRLILRAHTRCMGRSCAIPYLVSAGARGEAGYGFHSGKSALRAGITTDPGRLRRREGADRCRGEVS